MAALIGLALAADHVHPADPASFLQGVFVLSLASLFLGRRQLREIGEIRVDGDRVRVHQAGEVVVDSPCGDLHLKVEGTLVHIDGVTLRAETPELAQEALNLCRC